VSTARPEDRWGDASTAIRDLFAGRLAAALTSDEPDVARIRQLLADAVSEGLSPWDVYHAAIRACDQSPVPLPSWSTVAPRSRPA
jgi:hypothetical protein